MNPTGIIRRVDDLGRIVIPKEIRKQLHIREGEPLELFIDGTDIVWKKYSPLGIGPYTAAASTVLWRNDITFAIYDCDHRITTNNRSLFLENLPQSWFGKRTVFETESLTVFPVVVSGELLGYVAIKDIGNKADIVTTVISMVVEEMQEG